MAGVFAPLEIEYHHSKFSSCGCCCCSGSATSRNPYDARTPMPMGSALEKQIMAEEEERKQLEGESTELSQPAKRIGMSYWCSG